MARPRKEINLEHFQKLCEFQCTLQEIAGFFEVSEDTIERWCKRELKMSFADAFKKYGAMGKISLRRAQFKLAEKNASMAIFLGKNYLGQTDRYEQIVSDIEDLSTLADMLKDDADETND